MPRNGSGTYSLPGTYQAVTGETIEAQQHNDPLEDLQTDANTARPIVAGGTAATTAAGARTNLAAAGTGDDNTFTGDNTFSGINTFSGVQKWAKGADVASDNAVTLGDDGNYFDITGTTAITSIATKGVGTVVKLHFDGALTLTYDATALVLPGAGNITTAAGDEAEFIEYATGDWRLVNYQSSGLSPISVPLPRSYIDGCALANNSTDATNDIDIAAGVCRDSTNAFNITVAAMTKRLDANWAEGTTQGYRDSSASIANATYHVYAVAKADGTQDFYATTQETAAGALTNLQAETGGASYAYARRIGSILRESLAIVTFVQNGDDFMRKVPSQDYTGGWNATAGSVTLKVPVGIKMRSKIAAEITDTNAHNYLYIYDPALGDQAASATIFSSSTNGAVTGGFSSTTSGAATFDIWTNTSAQVKAVATSAVDGFVVVTLGWTDPRGKNG